MSIRMHAYKHAHGAHKYNHIRTHTLEHKHTHTHIYPHAQSNKYTNEFKHEGVNIHNAHKYNDICVHLLLLLALLCNSSLSSHYARLISLFVLFLFLFPDYSIRNLSRLFVCCVCVCMRVCMYASCILCSLIYEKKMLSFSAWLHCIIDSFPYLMLSIKLIGFYFLLVVVFFSSNSSHMQFYHNMPTK